MRVRLTFVALLLQACQLPAVPEVDAGIPVLPSEAELLAQRPFRLNIPSAYDPATKWPLVIGLHGYGGTAANFEQRWAIGTFAEEQGIFLALPNGLVDKQGNRAWNTSYKHAPTWDVEYLSAIIRSVTSRYSIDPHRVYIFGHSQGAHMAHRMGCDASELVSAFVSVAGQVTTNPVACAPLQPVSALQIHGTEDEAIGYYGDVQYNDPNVPNAHQTIGVWARNDHCSGEITKTGTSLDLSLDVDGDESFVEAYTCPDGLGVELWTMSEVTHWPSPTPEFLPLAWAFLEAHARH